MTDAQVMNRKKAFIHSLMEGSTERGYNTCKLCRRGCGDQTVSFSFFFFVVGVVVDVVCCSLRLKMKMDRYGLKGVDSPRGGVYIAMT